MFARLAALALLALPFVAADVDLLQNGYLTVCAGSESDHINIVTAFASAWPPVPGKDLTLTFTGSSDEAITSGTFDASVTFDGFPILDKTGNIGDLITLPAPAGPATITKTFAVPSAIPSGTLGIHITAVDQNNSQLVCVDVNGQVGARASSRVAKAAPRVVSRISSKRAVEALLANFGVAAANGLPAGYSTIPYTTCDDGAAHLLSVTTIGSTLFPPKAGKELSLAAVGTTSSDITGGSYSVTVSLSGFPIVTQSGKLSEIATLPFVAGTPRTLIKNGTIPSFLPAGDYDLQLTGVDQNGKNLGCVDVQWKV